jgi:hypothetical protein
MPIPVGDIHRGTHSVQQKLGDIGSIGQEHLQQRLLGLRDLWNESLSARRTYRIEGIWRHYLVATSAMLGTGSLHSMREPS